MKYNIHTFDTLASTNDTATESQYKNGDIITARFQSAGRGQRGNKWVSSEGENLMFSLVVEPTHILVREQFSLSMISAIATAQTIESFGVEKVTIKWPNDIYVADKKISGMLIEHSFSSEYLSKTIIGVGINVRQTQFEQSAGNPTSLHSLGAVDSTPERVLEIFCDKFSGLYNCSIEELHSEFCNRLYRREGFFPYEDTNGRFEAKIGDVDPHTGIITLIDKENNLREYYFKEVAYL